MCEIHFYFTPFQNIVLPPVQEIKFDKDINEIHQNTNGSLEESNLSPRYTHKIQVWYIYLLHLVDFYG